MNSDQFPVDPSLVDELFKQSNEPLEHPQMACQRILNRATEITINKNDPDWLVRTSFYNQCIHITLDVKEVVPRATLPKCEYSITMIYGDHIAKIANTVTRHPSHLTTFIMSQLPKNGKISFALIPNTKYF